ncbi:hypothetical protein [Bacillus wiedmannii]|uniref:YvrJ family protein n=1 Tax=Bacillus phage AP50 TaxID=2880538 RepID=B6RT51_9VIRU|nr:hypothetical protein [Bacillus wiedmannii]YP_002302531.1 holin [Bacillus phage AP50]ACB54918.1 hypothetical protein [Bacillus phage AP50]HDR7785254.1 hypothetical protein [Bacillus wiedmannii]
MEMEVAQFISNNGFAAFVAVFMLVKGSKDNQNMTAAINKLETAITLLNGKKVEDDK